MRLLRYSVAIDPIPSDSGAAHWMVLQESMDFEGWVIVAKAKTKDEAEAFQAQMEQLERQARKRWRHLRRA